MIEKGSDAAQVLIVGGRWDGATGYVVERTAGHVVVQLDPTPGSSNAPLVVIETADDQMASVIPRELGT